MEITAQKIFDLTCDFFRENPDKVKSSSQNGHVVMVRQIAIYFMDKYLDISFREMGKTFNGRSNRLAGGLNHATCMYSVKTVKNLIDTDKFYASNVEKIDKLINHE